MNIYIYPSSSHQLLLFLSSGHSYCAYSSFSDDVFCTTISCVDRARTPVRDRSPLPWVPVPAPDNRQPSRPAGFLRLVLPSSRRLRPPLAWFSSSVRGKFWVCRIPPQLLPSKCVPSPVTYQPPTSSTLHRGEPGFRVACPDLLSLFLLVLFRVL